MRKFISIFLLTVFVVLSFQDLAMYSVYKLNQSFITEKFCINKQKKELNCKGKCHYKKQITKSKNQQEKSNPVRERFEFKLLLEIIDENWFSEKDLLEHVSTYSDNFQDYYVFQFLRPPQSSSLST